MGIWVHRLAGQALSLVGVVLLTTSPVQAHEPIVAGYVENAWFKDGDITFQAKLDTGAKSSSINAVNSQVFKRDGKRWVSLTLENRQGQQYKIEAPVKKTVRIRRAGVKKQRRMIIDLEVCVGGKISATEFTLADRTGQSYQVLIGRKFMAGDILVRSSSKFLVSGRCKQDG